eukprot:CAMPEP_0206508524 /NCGR_PEP_ID=MMETSP0324_2-20121206/58396_1 /ASSEMBLY_ACC=CAM_ASM_000836 /TAXON_ID=2866 /ORGANISM="Crypthecodinium cohnii, Strain Seligo" /LENGTH=60 /DNA_ID=CAMNT_0053999429 /DNA_START=32 /DNA_END=210 /DNA_ORIENTATION=+
MTTATMTTSTTMTSEESAYVSSPQKDSSKTGLSRCRLSQMHVLLLSIFTGGAAGGLLGAL